MSILQKIRTGLKQFRDEHPNEQPIIRIDSSTQWEFIELTANEIGQEAVSAIFKNGPQVLSSAYGVRILWKSPQFGVEPATSSLLQNWETQEAQMRTSGTPRVGIRKG